METQYAEDPERMEVWINHNLYTYLLLAENCDYRQFEQKLSGFIRLRSPSAPIMSPPLLIRK